jgi:hypothetical protein
LDGGRPDGVGGWWVIGWWWAGWRRGMVGDWIGGQGGRPGMAGDWVRKRWVIT